MSAPLLSAWLSYVDNRPTAFTIPGHKGAADRLWPDLGRVLAGDVPLFGGLDTVKLSGGVLADAEARAAALWNADWCRFSTGGSTHANQALALAAASPGDTVLVSRSAHRSTLLGLVLAGLTPVWLPITVDPRFGLPIGVAVDDLRAALHAHPEARAVFLVEPGYLGAISDLAALVGVAHDAGRPVLVDQAWGAHFGFHPGLPPHALTAGADALVLSAHKTLPAYSQASMIFARTRERVPDRARPDGHGGPPESGYAYCLDQDRLERAFEAGNTTSPAGSILASIDGARALLATRGEELLDWLIGAVGQARHRLREVPGLRVPGPDDFPPGRYDPTKLVLLLAGTGASGIAVEQDLLAAGIPVELADHDTVVPIVTLADTDATVDHLVVALRTAVDHHRGRPRPLTQPTTPPAQLRDGSPGYAPSGEAPTDRTLADGGPAGQAPSNPAPTDHAPANPAPTDKAPANPTQPDGALAGPGARETPAAAGAMTPREAFFARHVTVEADRAVGQVSAEVVAPYPPGVPVLVPGEVITAEALHLLRTAQAQGTRIAYAADPTLRTLQIVDQP